MLVTTAIIALALAGCSSADTPPGSPGATHSPSDELAAFRGLYQELVEVNTTTSDGNCTEAATKMADRLKTAGYQDSDLVQFVPEGHPKDGGLVATLGGSDPTAKPILLLAHIDTVDAKREDWQYDPFKLREENGYFIARGAQDDKSMAAIWVDSLIRYRQSGFTPKRPIRIALTCGEEGGGRVNGAKWLHQNRPDLVDVEFVLNEGAFGELDANAKPVYLTVEAGQKAYQDFTLEATDEGGHSSQPRPFNPIVALGAGLERLAATPFPVQLNHTTRAYFTAQADLHPGEVGDAMRALVANPSDAAAAATVAQNPLYNGMMRTTCVATKIEGGHAVNALPQRAKANVNCRILPGVNPQDVQNAIAEAVADPKVSVTPASPFSSDVAVGPPLSPAILDPIKEVAATIWPGVPLVPQMSPWGTDAVYFRDTPVYGLNGLFEQPGESHIHGLNERLRVKSLYDSRDFLFELVKKYGSRS
ncbi:M20/M25/M40 family metallo-hydrolase [Nocardia rhizosphaerihabitans]|uniref:M20/M25/M40 family metallo-hydrolase n=1 Tax=Nocardia rhizosphaerihabitans TaxID=1691570 RepID=UPI003673530D